MIVHPVMTIAAIVSIFAFTSASCPGTITDTMIMIMFLLVVFSSCWYHSIPIIIVGITHFITIVHNLYI